MEYKKINKGFSIELNYDDSDLELYGEYNGLPLYKVIGGNIINIALVDKPANKHNCFISNEKQRILTGVVLVPNQKIYRDYPVDCYWFFPIETIEMLQKKYNNKQIKIGH